MGYSDPPRKGVWGGRSEHPAYVLSRGGTLLPSIHADARYIGAVIVSKACVFCTEGSDNNAHYWMFTVNVAATPTGLLYYQLPLNHAPDHLPRIPAVEPVPERLCCVICGDLFFDPVAVCDAHVFCRVCILRHIDGNKSCPLDRLPLSPESIRQSDVRYGKMETFFLPRICSRTLMDCRERRAKQSISRRRGAK